tara:strand:+ start:180 stop:1025 length:846 start_codon:yes stop_codon:yes gene_type:complete
VAKKKLLIITGVTGFVGSSLIKNKLFLENFDILGVNSKEYFAFENKLEIINKNVFLDRAKNYKDVSLIHLATLYDLNEENKELIYKANYNFGTKFIEALCENKIYINSILYTNTAFIYSEDENIRKSSYVISKDNFSQYLNKFSKKNNINLMEIYLSNTFGLGDKRNKLIPNMIKSIKSGEEFIINNPSAFINILDVEILIEEFFRILNFNKSIKCSMFSKHEFSITSIYEFLDSLINNKKITEIISELSSAGDLFPDDINNTYFEFNLSKSLTKICNHLS